MKHLSLVLFLVLDTTVFAQKQDFPFDQFHRQTIEHHFRDTLSNPLLIIASGDYSNLPKRKGGQPVKYFASLEQVIHYMKKPWVKNHQQAYRIRDSILNQDTVDIIIAQLDVQVKFRLTLISGYCGGDMGYIPAARFVRREDWYFISGKELRNKRQKEINKMLGLPLYPEN